MKRVESKKARIQKVGRNFLLLSMSGLVLSTPLVGQALSGGNLFNVASVINRMNQTMWSPTLPSLDRLSFDSRTSSVPALGQIQIENQTINGQKVPTLKSAALNRITLSSPFLGLEGRSSLQGIPAPLTSVSDSISPLAITNSNMSSKFFTTAQPAEMSPITDLFADTRTVAPGDVYNQVKWDPATGNVAVEGKPVTWSGQ